VCMVATVLDFRSHMQKIKMTVDDSLYMFLYSSE